MIKILFAICFFGFSFNSQAQKEPLPKDHPIAKVAPHLPLFKRFVGEGKVFYGEKFTYNFELNEAAIKQWMKNFPEEVKAYKNAISNYIDSPNPSLLSEIEKELFCDLKSQWYMISQIN